MAQKVLVTRPRAQSADFGAALQAAGFEPVYFPVIEIHPLPDLSALDQALAHIERYDWVIFTSANAVNIVGERAREARPASLAARKIAAVGPKTAAALQDWQLQAALVPDEYLPEALLPGLGALRGRHLLLLRAEIARPALPQAIAAAGGALDEVAVYQTLPAQPDPAGLAALRAGVDWLTFTSPSSVQNFAALARRHGLDPLRLPGDPRPACIGPITLQAAREEGFNNILSAQEYTAMGLVEAIAAASPAAF